MKNFEVGFFIKNYNEDLTALYQAIAMQGGWVIEKNTQYIIAEFPPSAGSRGLVLDNTYFWCCVR